ncbi:MAG: molybdopterin-guanine dinucleotide biosynthesis protein B [Candidatus Bathyarchaeia archaeon]
MIIIAVLGVSNSGKTTTIEYLTRQLTMEGYKVGSIKHIHHEDFSIDSKGTDTWRHAQAGSKIVVAISPRETVIIKKTESSQTDIDQVIKLLSQENLDFIFIEGLSSQIAGREDIPKIVTAREIDDLMERVKNAKPIIAVTGAIAKKGVAVNNIPVIDLETGGQRLVELVKQQLKHKNMGET